jgi:hypothetical protein
VVSSAVAASACGAGETSGKAAASRPGSATRRSSSALSGPKRPGCAASSLASSSPATSAIHAQPADAIGVVHRPERRGEKDGGGCAQTTRTRSCHEPAQPRTRRKSDARGRWSDVISTGASGDNRFDLTAARRPCHCSSVEREAAELRLRALPPPAGPLHAAQQQRARTAAGAACVWTLENARGLVGRHAGPPAWWPHGVECAVAHPV